MTSKPLTIFSILFNSEAVDGNGGSWLACRVGGGGDGVAGGGEGALGDVAPPPPAGVTVSKALPSGEPAPPPPISDGGGKE